MKEVFFEVTQEDKIVKEIIVLADNNADEEEILESLKVTAEEFYPECSVNKTFSSPNNVGFFPVWLNVGDEEEKDE